MVVYEHCGLFFTTSSGKSFVDTSQHHDALRNALVEYFLVDSRVHLSSLRCRSTMCCELRSGRMSGLPWMSSLSCGPAASTSSARALKNNQSGPSSDTLFGKKVRCGFVVP